MSILATFSGKYGDILWSLPTVRALSSEHCQRIHFGIMPQYESLVPLLNEQPYIEHAFIFPEWQCTGSPHGDQPWNPPDSVLVNWERAFHLTYKETPREFLGDWIAKHAGQTLQPGYIEPFISVADRSVRTLIRQTHELINHANKYVAVGFNEMYADQKDAFVSQLSAKFPWLWFIDVTQYNWQDTAYLIKHAAFFIGCRSSNHVLAHGLGQKLLIYEPHPHRAGEMPIFTCPWGTERQANSVEEALPICSGWLND